jgi:hypothetical protein
MKGKLQTRMQKSMQSTPYNNQWTKREQYESD